MQTTADHLNIPGLYYASGVFNEAERQTLLTHIDSYPWSRKFKRRGQEYGVPYEFRTKALDPFAPLVPMPDFILSLANELSTHGLAHSLPDQCSIDEYVPGEGISAHVDGWPFADGITIATLGHASEMEFIHRLNGEIRRFTPEVGSVVYLTGPSRYDWLHGIPARTSDAGIQRQRRVSIIMRKSAAFAARKS